MSPDLYLSNHPGVTFILEGQATTTFKRLPQDEEPKSLPIFFPQLPQSS